MEEGSDKANVTFNLGIEWNYKISNKIDAAMNYYMNGDFMGWFFSVKAIKFLLISYLSKDERKELEDMESDIGLANKKKKNIAPLVETYDIRIKDLLSSYGFLNPLKKDQTKLFGQD